MSKSKKSEKKLKMSETMDKHVLYQESVQCVEAEIDFVDETYENLRNRKARWLREDFCGTANTSAEWVKRRTGNHAVGVDLDESVLQWGEQHNCKPLGKAANRLQLIHGNVLTTKTREMDVVLAMNFSYWLFRERSTLREYFKKVKNALAKNGIFFLDIFGGYEAAKEQKEKTKFDDFTYIWHQAKFDPINSFMRCHIHFRFPDGSRMKKAFTYEWRLWTIPEVTELLQEAGFSRVTVYWEGTGEDGEGNGEYYPAEEGDADASYITYITAER